MIGILMKGVWHGCISKETEYEKGCRAGSILSAIKRMLGKE